MNRGRVVRGYHGTIVVHQRVERGDGLCLRLGVGGGRRAEGQRGDPGGVVKHLLRQISARSQL